mmetsp:Transcript_20399/g.29886  ORF Transcript_20399/g.29886 Transcript_20399/m.29886 type:complete len:912 (-) Transcript_20399:597-3332(-)
MLSSSQRRTMRSTNRNFVSATFTIVISMATQMSSFQSINNQFYHHQQHRWNELSQNCVQKEIFSMATAKTKMRARQKYFAINENTHDNEGTITKNNISKKEKVSFLPQKSKNEILNVPSLRNINAFPKQLQRNNILSSSFVAASMIFLFSLFLPMNGSAAMANDSFMSTSTTTVHNADITAKVIAAAITNPSTTNNNNDKSQNSVEPTSRKYWSIQSTSDVPLIRSSNMALLDHAVGTINTMYYDSSGGAYFDPRDMYDRFRALRILVNNGDDALKQWLEGKYSEGGNSIDGNKRKNIMRQRLGISTMPGRDVFDNRENTVDGLKWLVSTLNDPYSKYLTREELRNEFLERNDGFLGLGVFVEPPQHAPPTLVSQPSYTAAAAATTTTKTVKSKSTPDLDSTILTYTRVANLPIVTAVAPDSPAERSGIVVGDRIAAVGDYKFMGTNREEIGRALKTKYNAENYVGHPEITIVKPVKKMVITSGDSDNDESKNVMSERQQLAPRETVTGYRLSRVRLPTSSIEPFTPFKPNRGESVASSTAASASIASTSASTASLSSPPPRLPVVGGDSIVHYELLTPMDTIFGKIALSNNMNNIGSSSTPSSNDGSVGYIRLTRFSRASTAGYINAISKLEEAGAQSFIIDVRNNYGGIIQEAMLSASTLLRDPHMVLCYTMNSRGGFTPHDVEEYIVDSRFPGYLLSSEDRKVTRNQVAREKPDMFEEDGIMWVPPSSFASLHEQKLKRGLHPPTTIPAMNAQFVSDTSSSSPSLRFLPISESDTIQQRQRQAQKKIVILVNEGTASSAEFFASALRDNGRIVALVGAKTYGKGLIQHTFPMPDGGGLRLTVAEYLTPTLKHVTKVGNARYDRDTGELVGGGIRPDVYCPSNQGIPKNIGSDICVGMALDVLDDAGET